MVLVTGATSGIGVETARVLALRGAHVYLVGRNPKKLEQTLVQLKQSLPAAQSKLSTLVCDLNDLNSVKHCAKQFLHEEKELDILVNNAGIMALQPRQETQQGLEAQVGVCHVGHFYLAKLLLPALQAASKTHGSARVAALSSSAHTYHEIQSCLANEKLDTSPYDPWTAYGNAKAANLLFAKGFNDRYAQGAVSNIYAFSVMPGGIYTGLQDNIDLRSKINYMTVAPFFFKTVPQGAATSIFCAMAPWNSWLQVTITTTVHPKEMLWVRYWNTAAALRQMLWMSAGIKQKDF